MRIFFVLMLCTYALSNITVLAQSPIATKCRRLAATVSDLNYHRSETPELATGQIWHFGAKGKLSIYKSAAGGLSKAEKLSEALWAIAEEDGHCAFKITSQTTPPRTVTFRITDTTWAIYTVAGEDKHVPDFEDHSGMKTRYCGMGKICEKLWR